MKKTFVVSNSERKTSPKIRFVFAVSLLSGVYSFKIDFTLEGMQRFVMICMSQVKVWSKIEKSEIFLFSFPKTTYGSLTEVELTL